jgi:hypothetical protein
VLNDVEEKTAALFFLFELSCLNMRINENTLVCKHIQKQKYNALSTSNKSYRPIKSKNKSGTIVNRFTQKKEVLSFAKYQTTDPRRLFFF